MRNCVGGFFLNVAGRPNQLDGLTQGVKRPIVNVRYRGGKLAGAVATAN
jgi:hypothetical protein